MPAETEQRKEREATALARANAEAQAAFERFEQAAAKARELAGEKPRQPAQPYGPADYFWYREGLIAGASAERERVARIVETEAMFAIDGIRLARLIRGGSGKV